LTAISLDGRVVLVTGGSRGLGREMALALARAGAKVAVTGSGPSDALARTCADLGGDALAIAADVTDAAAAEDAVDRTVAAFGRLDVLVNNAGLGLRVISETFNTQPTKFWEAPTDAWRAIVDTNVNGPFLMARAAVPQMLKQRYGKIINISTSDQTMVRRGYAPYGPSKAFLEAASRVWAADLAGLGVDVNVLLPGGAANTDLLPPAQNKKGADGNLLSADVMNQAMIWLASKQSDGITGARYIARLWQADRPDAARDDAGGKPRLM
jgi:NAD(P)-dependent dehydrogenase (short-subunit alcohol dehydrogenase family)